MNINGRRPSHERAARILKDLKLKLRVLKIEKNKNKNPPAFSAAGPTGNFCVFSIFDAIILMAFRAAFVNKAQRDEIFVLTKIFNFFLPVEVRRGFVFSLAIVLHVSR